VPSKDAGALASAMLKIMTLPKDERIAMGLRGREWVEERFSLKAVLDQWESIYTELMAKKVKP
ncbi:hypothetical protein, partial [Thermus antranikianii]